MNSSATATTLELHWMQSYWWRHGGRQRTRASRDRAAINADEHFDASRRRTLIGRQTSFFRSNAFLDGVEKNVRWMLVWCRWWTRSRVDVPRRAGAARRRLIKATASRAPSSDKLLISCALQTNPAGTTEPVSMRADWFPVCWSEEQSGRRVYGSDENKTERNSIYYVNNDATISCWLVVLDFINVSFQQQDVQRTSKRCH